MILSISSGQWISLFANTILQSMLLLAAALFALTCMRNASAATRHAVSLAALIALPLVPIIQVVTPASRHKLPISIPTFTAVRSSSQSLTGSTTRSPEVSASASISVATTRPFSASPTLLVSPSRPVSPTPALFASATRRHSPVFPLLFASRLLALIWLPGVFIVLFRLLCGMLQLRDIARRGSADIEDCLLTRVDAVLTETRYVHGIRILQTRESNAIPAPMTWGAFRPTILLPADAADWPDRRLRVVLLHELAHTARQDWLTQTLSKLVCALYWFHPFVWLLYRQCQIEAERACDDAVLRAGVTAPDYAGQLLEVVMSTRAQKRKNKAPCAAVTMARPRQLRYRMKSILDARRRRKPASRSVLTLLLIITGLMLLAVSPLRPVAGASERTQSTAQTNSESTGKAVTLPEGVTVELVAVGSDPGGLGDDWWTPEGKPLIESPWDKSTIFHGYGNGLPERLLRRSFFVRLSTKKPVNLSTTGYVVDTNGELHSDLYHFGRDVRINIGQVTPTYPTVGAVLLGFPKGYTHCSYRLGVASGPWETISTTSLSLNPAPRPPIGGAGLERDEATMVLDDTPHIEYWDDKGKQQDQPLLAGHAPLGDVARRIVVLDKSGKETPLEFPEEDYKGGFQRIPNTDGAHSVELRLETRPYQWVEFKDIVLEHPVVKAVPAIATPPALPAFVHTFACGITLAAPAVTEKPVDGGLWWRPDGKLLAGPLKEYQKAVKFRNWRHGTHPRVVALQLKSPRTVSYTAATRFSNAVPDYNEDMLPGAEQGIERGHMVSWIGHDFPQNLKHTTIRYGIAAGPWKTAGTIPMPKDIRRVNDARNPNNGDLTLTLYGYPKAGETPLLEYTAADGALRAVPFQNLDPAYLKDVARRFVAIDIDGKAIPLRSNNASKFVVDRAGKPVPLDPANAGKVGLMVGDYYRREMDLVQLSFFGNNGGYANGVEPLDLSRIREFRLEIRPYEWAEFHDVALQPDK